MQFTKFSSKIDTFFRYLMAVWPERRDILKNTLLTGSRYSYGSSTEEILVLSSCNWKIHPGVLLERVNFVCDELGQRAELNRLIRELEPGDTIGVTSVAALEDTGDPDSLIQRLQELQEKGIFLSVAYGPEYDFDAYSEMLRQWETLEDLRGFYRNICVKSIGYKEKVQAGSTPLKGGE